MNVYSLQMASVLFKIGGVHTIVWTPLLVIMLRSPIKKRVLALGHKLSVVDHTTSQDDA